MRLQLDIELVEYVQLLREGILEAYVGIVSAFKSTEKVGLLLPHVPAMLELCQKCVLDSDRPDATTKLVIGLIGDLADAFPNGEIKNLLLEDWIALELRGRNRSSSELKKMARWAREVSSPHHVCSLSILTPGVGCQACDCIDVSSGHSRFSVQFLFVPPQLTCFRTMSDAHNAHHIRL